MPQLVLCCILLPLKAKICCGQSPVLVDGRALLIDIYRIALAHWLVAPISPVGWGCIATTAGRCAACSSVASEMELRVSNYRIHFAKQILGVPFTVGSVDIARARDQTRALRAAELRFARQHGVVDWRERADIADIAATHDDA